MYTDKINPNHPEGRLLILSNGFHLKQPGLQKSPIALQDKADALFKYLNDKGFESGTELRMRKTYKAICNIDAARNIGRYNILLKDMPKEQKFLSWWLLYDYYDMLPDGSRVNAKAAYYRLNQYYRDIIDMGMKASIDVGLRDLTISMEASMTAPFFLYLQDKGVRDMSQLHEKHVRNFASTGRCNPMTIYRIGHFIKRYADYANDKTVQSVLHFFPKEKLIRRVYDAFSHDDRATLEAFVLSEDCPLSKRDRAITVLMLYTGMRACDVKGLKLGNIDWARNVIRFCQRKTLAELELPLRPVVGNFLHDYISTERPKCDNEQIFLSRVTINGRYTCPNVIDVLNKTYGLCGIRQNGQRKGTHLLRHSLADEMVNQGNDVTMVARTLGHRSPNTSLGYMSSNIEMLRSCALSIEQYPVMHKLYCHE